MVPFVGRQSELAVLRERLLAATNGTPQTVLVQGPAGIGKTALVEHFLAELAADPSSVVVRASGEDTEQLLAYGVMDQLVRSVPDTGSSRVRATATDDQGHLEDPVTVGTRFLELLDRLAGTTVVVAIDDAQWADRPSLQAVMFALRRLVADRVLTVLAVRDEDVGDLPGSVHRLIGRPTGRVVALGGLGEDDLRHLAGALGVDGIGPVDARRLWYGTHGNPLHARALLEEFPPSDWGPDEGLLPSPRSFRRLVRDRYLSCSPATRMLVDAAAVLGPHAPMHVVAALADIDDPLAAVDEAISHELLRPPEAPARWSLSAPHPLVRAAVYDSLGPSRRHALHTAAAARLTDPATVLRHRVAAASGPDDELAADLSRFAGLEAARHSWPSAAAHLLSASRLSTDPADAGRRLLQAVVLTMLRGDAARAGQLAAELRTRPGGPLPDVVSGSIAMAADDPESAERLLAQAWKSSDPADTETAGVIALMTAIHWYGRLDGAATVRWCSKALALLSPGTSIHAVAQTYLVHGLGYAGRPTESMSAAQSAQETPGNSDRLWLSPRSARGVLRLVDDDYSGARADLESVAVTASGLGILNTSSFGYAYLARAEWMVGEWDQALVHAERAVAINVESDFTFMHSAVIGIAVLVPAARGDWITAEAYLRSMSENEAGYERSMVALAMSRARIGEARGDPHAVLAALDPVRRFAVRDAVDEPGFWAWPDLYSDALVATGSVAEADTFLRPHEERALQRGRRTVLARLARSRGRIEAAAGRPENAEAAFDRAMNTLRGLSVPFETARIELATGTFLARAGHGRRAAELLMNARHRLLLLGALPYADQCARELAASGLDPGRAIGHGRPGLTSQELVVARLAATGLTNRELAADLVVSIKTIEFHLRNAFAKLGVTSRRQLASGLARLPEESAPGGRIGAPTPRKARG